jgi:hypothetical protein
MPKATAVILTVLDYPNDSYTFIAETGPTHSTEAQHRPNMNPEYLRSKDILDILGGTDSCGDNVYLGGLEIRYFDGVSFVARNHITDNSYKQITGTVSFHTLA